MKQLVIVILIFLQNTSFAQTTDQADLNYFHLSDYKKEDISLYTVKQVQLYGYLRIEYVEQGNSSGIPVIFLHDFSDSWHSFELLLPHLPSNIHAFVLSQRGHGNSDKPLVGYTPGEFADDIAAFMDLLEIRSAIIVGHSMGATIAQIFAIKYPRYTSSIVLAGSVARFRNEAGVNDLQRAIVDRLNPVDLEFNADFQKDSMRHFIPDAFCDTIINESLKLPAHVWKAVIDGLSKVDYTKRLASIKVPALIIWGDKDFFATYPDQEVLHDLIAGSRLMIYRGIGHASHWEDPVRFAEDLVSFIREVTTPLLAKERSKAFIN